MAIEHRYRRQPIRECPAWAYTAAIFVFLGLLLLATSALAWVSVDLG